MIKKLQVVEDFCKNVIEILCEPSNKKYISELSDKYTYILLNGHYLISIMRGAYR